MSCGRRGNKNNMDNNNNYDTPTTNPTTPAAERHHPYPQNFTGQREVQRSLVDGCRSVKFSAGLAGGVRGGGAGWRSGAGSAGVVGLVF